MNTQVEPVKSFGDTLKQVVSFILVVCSLAGFYYFSEYSLLYRVLALLVVFLLVFGLMLTTTLGKRFLVFLRDSRTEVRKVVWPGKDETIRTTVMVFAMVFLVGLFLWLLDMLLFWGVRLLTGQGG